VFSVYGVVLWQRLLIDFMDWWWGLWVGVGLLVCLIEWRLLPLFLLAKDIDYLLELY
jgi:hypothetical protein